jgi:hypothetical protein
MALSSTSSTMHRLIFLEIFRTGALPSNTRGMWTETAARRNVTTVVSTAPPEAAAEPPADGGAA